MIFFATAIYLDHKLSFSNGAHNVRTFLTVSHGLFDPVVVETLSKLPLGRQISIVRSRWGREGNGYCGFEGGIQYLVEISRMYG